MWLAVGKQTTTQTKSTIENEVLDLADDTHFFYPEGIYILF